jgi:arylsulfatase A-like enzyme
MNIVLVIFDSLRKDCVSIYGAPPWGKVSTPHFEAFAAKAVVFNRAFPESLPTLPARRAIYTGNRVYPFSNDDIFLKGDFKGAPGWGPIPENESTLAEILKENGYRTGLICDVYHMFKPSKNFWRGFNQWVFLRGQEADPARSGPGITQEQIDYWFPEAIRNKRPDRIDFLRQCIMNIQDRTKEEDYFAPRVLKESALWLEQNQDADKFFLAVECFDPHEPWLAPAHYRNMYRKQQSFEQVMSIYEDLSDIPEELIALTRANYSSVVSLCDRWFGYFMESMRVLGLLDNTMIIFTADHGHSIGDRNYLGKRGYPSTPEVYDVPLMIRFPKAQHAGLSSEIFVQHHDISAQILETIGVKPPKPIDGVSFLADAIAGKNGQRDHVTVAWGSTVTVITDKWWLNCKVDGTGVLLYDLKNKVPFANNVAEGNSQVIDRLFAFAKADAGGSFPDWLINLAKNEADAPGCSDLVARS